MAHTAVHEAAVGDVDDPGFRELVARAQQADEAEKALTLRETVKKYKKACAWSLVLSFALVMDGFFAVILGSYYGQTAFQQKFGQVLVPGGAKEISAAWQAGLSDSSSIGAIFGLLVTSWAADRYGSRPTMIFFFVWIIAVIFVSVFAVDLPMLLVGSLLASVGTGSFQTLTTTYASEVVPVSLRHYTTAWVCLAWGIGLTISAGTVRGCLNLSGDWSWRLPFVLQWVYPPVLLVVAYLAPESPWNSMRRDKPDEARRSLRRLMTDPTDDEVEARVAYIKHTLLLEKAESADTSFFDCFKGTNARRTEINMMAWAIQILCGNAILSYAVVFLEAAGFSETQAFDLNIGLDACQIAGGFLSWWLMAKYGRATLYIGGQLCMFLTLVPMGILGFVEQTKAVSLTIGILLLASTFFNLTTTGPVCYPIVAETPAGRLRNKTITIGRTTYLITAIVCNSLTPHMISATSWNWGAKCGLFYAGTNLLCNIWCWFRLPETKDRTFGEIDILFENKVPARKFKYTKVDEFSHHQAANLAAVEKLDEEKNEVSHIEAA